MSEKTDIERDYFGVPDVKIPNAGVPPTEEEMAAAMASVERNDTAERLRRFVDAMEAHPTSQGAWDMSIPFSEFARRVRAGDHD